MRNNLFFGQKYYLKCHSASLFDMKRELEVVVKTIVESMRLHENYIEWLYLHVFSGGCKDNDPIHTFEL